MSTINITRNSPTHVALCYLGMKHLHFSTKEQIYNISPSKFRRPSTVIRSLNVLIRMGFAIQKEGCYAITSSGRQALYQIVKEQPCKENSA